jgi:hypothetical protein
MPRLLIGLAVVIVFFTVFVIVDTALTPRTRMRGLPKPAWVAVVVLVPVIGGILWLTVGKDRTDLARSSGRRLGPDDDPDFLSNLGRARSEQERDPPHRAGARRPRQRRPRRQGHPPRRRRPRVPGRHGHGPAAEPRRRRRPRRPRSPGRLTR